MNKSLLLNSWLPVMLGVMLVVLLFFSLPATAVGYIERFEPDDDSPTSALHGVMPVGEMSGWTAHMQGGFYRLENRTDPTDVRYYYVMPGKSTWTQPGDTIRVDVGGMLVGGDFHSGAGLLFRFEPATGHYYAFVLQDNQTFALYRRDAEGLRPLVSSGSSAIKRAGRNRLEVQLKGEDIYLLINGVELGNVSSSKVQGSGVGLIALGEGIFEFDDFELPNAQVSLDVQTPSPASSNLQTQPSHAPYEGRFEGSLISVELRRQGDAYIGSLQMGSEVCELTGRSLNKTSGSMAFAQAVKGRVQCSKEQFQFEAQLSDRDNLLFDLEGIRNKLSRLPPLPLSSPQSRSPSLTPPESPSIPSDRQSPKKLPASFQTTPHGSASGELLLKKEADYGANTTRMVRDALDSFAGYFDGRPSLLQAFGDPEGREIQVLFNARRNAVSVQGLMIVMVSGNEAFTAIAYDETRHFQHSLPGMVQALQTRLPRLPHRQSRNAEVQPLQQTGLPDGSGSIGLPMGWRITSAHKGMVDAVGPDGSMLALGIHGTALTPEGISQTQQLWSSVGNPGSYGAGLLVIPFSDPVTTFTTFWQEWPNSMAQILGKQQPSQRVLRTIEHAPIAWPGGQAAMLDVEWELGGANPRVYRSITLFGMQPGYAGMWTYYFSTVSSPTELFQQNIPTLKRIWGSWRVASSVYQERIEKSFADLKEVGRIIDQVHDERQKSLDAIHADWTEYNTDTTRVADLEVGELYDAPLYDINRLVAGLNKAAGYQRYQHIPLRDLQ